MGERVKQSEDYFSRNISRLLMRNTEHKMTDEKIRLDYNRCRS